MNCLILLYSILVNIELRHGLLWYCKKKKQNKTKTKTKQNDWYNSRRLNSTKINSFQTKKKSIMQKNTLTKRFFRKMCTNWYEWLQVNTYCSPCFNSSVSNQLSLRRLTYYWRWTEQTFEHKITSFMHLTKTITTTTSISKHKQL